jgi:hypothetical protein
MFEAMSTIRNNFLDFVRLIFPKGTIVSPSNDSAHYPASYAIGIEVSDRCVDVYARVLVGEVPIYIERSLGEDGSLIYYGKLYKSSDKYGEVFTDLLEEAESRSVVEFAKLVRAWTK